MTESQADRAATPRGVFREWIATAIGSILIFVAATAIFVAALWVVNEAVDDREVKLAAAFIFGLAFLLSVIASIVAAFAALKLTSPQSALGLPEGSIRAIIALVLVLIFVLMAVYLMEAVFVAKNPSTQAQNAATALLATLGTLVAAVSAFYFGTGAVTSGAQAISQATASAGRDRPTAVTKGSKWIEDHYVLVGVVNPRGRETSWYFEYGETTVYGNQTQIASAGGGDAEREVSAAVPEKIALGWHFRFVALSQVGISHGADAIVTDPPHGTGGEAEGGPPPQSPDDSAQNTSAGTPTETPETDPTADPSTT